MSGNEGISFEEGIFGESRLLTTQALRKLRVSCRIISRDTSSSTNPEFAVCIVLGTLFGQWLRGVSDVRAEREKELNLSFLWQAALTNSFTQG